MADHARTMSHRARIFGWEFALAFPGALLILAVVAFLTRTPEGNSTGFPLPWGSPISPCPEPNPFNGCGFSYSVDIVLLDYLIWAALLFAITFIVHRVLIRFLPRSRLPPKSIGTS